MNDRDRQKPYGRSQQRGGAYRDEGYGRQQPYQWQSDDHRQPGEDWQDDGRGARSERPYRPTGYDQRSYRGDQEYRGDYDRPDDWGMRRRSQRSGSPEQSYYPRDFDASGGNDFGNFTSEDYGGRDFYNRGGPSGGMRSSESYRPSYGVSSWFRNDDDRQRDSGDYSGWRHYGESRGFLQRAGDEVASWFGDDDASQRREMDRREDHRGRGPANYTRSDERICEDANDHLTHDWGVDASNITVSVRDGEVTLDGTVDSRQAKRRAEDCVDDLSGVKHVQNNLRVQDRSAGSYRSGSASGWRENGRSDAVSGERGSEFSSGNETTAANTTNGIGSGATAGVINASGPRSSDKTS